MATQQTPDGTLAAIDARLRHVEAQVDAIHRALVGTMDGSSKGLQARVERLETWARWIATVVTALTIAAFGQLMNLKGLR